MLETLAQEGRKRGKRKSVILIQQSETAKEKGGAKRRTLPIK